MEGSRGLVDVEYGSSSSLMVGRKEYESCRMIFFAGFVFGRGSRLRLDWILCSVAHDVLIRKP